MKIPQRILGLIAAAPVIAGCGADASEPPSTINDQNVSTEARRPDAEREPAVAAPRPSEEAAPRPSESEHPSTSPAAIPELAPMPSSIPGGFSSPGTGRGDPCLACGMG